MPVDAVMDDVDLGIGEPFEERLVRIVQHLVPFLEPLQLVGLLLPETQRVLAGPLRHGIPVLEDRLVAHLLRGIIDLPFQLRHIAISLSHHEQPPPPEQIGY